MSDKMGPGSLHLPEKYQFEAGVHHHVPPDGSREAYLRCAREARNQAAHYRQREKEAVLEEDQHQLLYESRAKQAEELAAMFEWWAEQ